MELVIDCLGDRESTLLVQSSWPSKARFNAPDSSSGKSVYQVTVRRVARRKRVRKWNDDPSAEETIRIISCGRQFIGRKQESCKRFKLKWMLEFPFPSIGSDVIILKKRNLESLDLRDRENVD